MRNHDRPDNLDHRSLTGRNLLLLGLWVRSAVAGAFFAAGALAALIDPSQRMSFLTALTWIAAGSTFAWLAWKRTIALLDRIDAGESTPVDRGDPSSIGGVSRVPVSFLRISPPKRCQLGISE